MLFHMNRLKYVKVADIAITLLDFLNMKLQKSKFSIAFMRKEMVWLLRIQLSIILLIQELFV